MAMSLAGAYKVPFRCIAFNLHYLHTHMHTHTDSARVRASPVASAAAGART